MQAPIPDVSKPVCAWQIPASLGEGTFWSSQKQRLYWVDILGHALHAYDPTQEHPKTWRFMQAITAVTECTDANQLLVTLRNDFAYFDLQTEQLTLLHRPEPDMLSNRFNDGKCDRHGNFWSCTMDENGMLPTGHLYRYRSHGECTRIACHFKVTNGPAFSPDGQFMYLNDTVSRRVVRFHLNALGDIISEPMDWLTFHPEDGYPDGMTVDRHGRVWIAHWGGGCVSCHDPQTAQEVLRIPLPCTQVTNCCFGGKNLNTLFITTASTGLSSSELLAQPLAGSLFSVDTSCQGIPSHRFSN